MHKDQLCKASSVFQAPFASEVKENFVDKMELPAHEAVTFDIFLQWLYTHECEIVTENDEFLLEPSVLATEGEGKDRWRGME